jgi:hypothetical protein
MHKVYSHDLPNQIVALQSLLQMLQLEETDRLSKDGREYVERLQKVSQRTSQMVRFLKEMGRLHAYIAKPEVLSLNMLARELQASVRQQFPQLEAAYDWQWNVAAIDADYRTFSQALSELLSCLLPSDCKACRVRALAQIAGNQIAVDFFLAASGTASDNKPNPGLGRGCSPPPAERMEVTLARELLAISEATLEIDPQGNGGIRFTIFLPNR